MGEAADFGAYFALIDGGGWVRVQHRDGGQMLMPWPSFDGWDDVFPPSIGTADAGRGGYLIADLANTVADLKSRSACAPRVGIWSDVVP